MQADGAGQPTFADGSTVVLRNMLDDRVWTAAPYRVVQDTGRQLVLATWPGAVTLKPTTWIESVRGDDDTVRRQGIINLAAGQWELGRWTWQRTTLLRRSTLGDYFSVSQFTDGAGGVLSGGWYVDFIRPWRRAPRGIDTFDLFLDLEVRSDLSYQWKDEDEYAHARRLGLIDDALHRHVESAREQVVSLTESRQGPWAENWSSWQRDPDWPTPVLPAGMSADPG